MAKSDKQRAQKIKAKAETRAELRHNGRPGHSAHPLFVMTAMKTIELDARGWRTQNDFYEALLPAIGAPEWHGYNLDALWNSVTCGDINRVSPPFIVRVRNVAEAELRPFLVTIERLFRDAKAEGIDVQFILAPENF